MYHKSRKVIIAKSGGIGIRKLVKVGNGVALFIPREFLRNKGLCAGEEVALRWDGELSIQPLGRGVRDEQ